MKRNLSLILIIFISGLALFINVGSYGVLESSEARYAEIAREMNETGDYLHPLFLNIHHYHKPPLTYDLTILAYKLFGVSDFSARFFLQIAIIIQLILVYALSMLLFKNRRTALWAAIIYFSFPIVLISSRNLTTDTFLTTFVLLAIYIWVKYRQNGKIKYLYLFAISMSLGFLTKGPVVFLVPVSFIIFYNQSEKPKKKLGINHILAVGLFLAIASSWFVYLSIQNVDFIDYFLKRQTVDRFSKNVFDRAEPFWYFLAFTPLMGFPWVVFIPYLVAKKKAVFKKKSIYIALIAGVTLPLLFFSISSSKRILYILPFFSLIAILLAQLISQFSFKQVQVISKIVLAYILVIVLAFIGFILLSSNWYLPKIFILSGSLIIIAAILLFKTKKITLRDKPMYLTFMISIFLVVEATALISANQHNINSKFPVEFIKEKSLENRDILIYNSRKPSIAFGLKKSIISLNDGNELLNREIQFEKNLNWKKTLINMKDEKEMAYLKLILNKPTVLVVYKHPLAVDQKWLLDYYKNKETMSKWTIYY